MERLYIHIQKWMNEWPIKSGLLVYGLNFYRKTNDQLKQLRLIIKSTHLPRERFSV